VYLAILDGRDVGWCGSRAGLCRLFALTVVARLAILRVRDVTFRGSVTREVCIYEEQKLLVAFRTLAAWKVSFCLH